MYSYCDDCEKKSTCDFHVSGIYCQKFIPLNELNVIDDINEIVCDREKIYISGKISGLPTKYVVEKFNETEKYLKNKYKCDVVNPIEIARLNELPHWEWEHYMVADIQELKQCTSIFMQVDYTDSIGAMVELAIAEQLGINIIFEQVFDKRRILKILKWIIGSTVAVCLGIAMLDARH